MPLFGTGISGSVVGGIYGGQSYPASAGQAGEPAASAGPTGSPSLVAAAWGTDEQGNSPAGNVAAIVGAVSWGLLIFMWYVAPK